MESFTLIACKPIADEILQTLLSHAYELGQEVHQQISICSWDVNGLTVNKLISLSETINQYDIIFFYETWLKPNYPFNLNVQGYKSHSVCRKQTNRKSKRGSGGLLCYIKEEIANGVHFVDTESYSED